MDVIEMLLFGYGIYVIFLHIKMKNTGEIPTALVSNRINMASARDIPGYISYTFPRGIVFGVIVSACSAAIYFRSYVGAIVALAAEIIFLITLIVHAVITIKAQKKYLIQGGK